MFPPKPQHISASAARPLGGFSMSTDDIINQFLAKFKPVKKKEQDLSQKCSAWNGFIPGL